MLPAAVHARDQMLATVLRPAHTPAERDRRDRDRSLLDARVVLDAEAASDVRGDDAHGALVASERLGQLLGGVMRRLRRTGDDHLAGGGVEAGDNAAALHRQAGLARDLEATLDDHLGGVELRVGVAALDDVPREQVVAPFGMEQRRIRLEPPLGVQHDRQRLEFELDELAGVLGQVTILRDHDRYRLAHVPDPVLRQQRRPCRTLSVNGPADGHRACTEGSKLGGPRTPRARRAPRAPPQVETARSLACATGLRTNAAWRASGAATSPT